MLTQPRSGASVRRSAHFLDSEREAPLRGQRFKNIVNNFSGYKSEIIIKEPGLNREYTGDNTKLLSIIKDFKFTSYQEGMKKLYEENKAVYCGV